MTWKKYKKYFQNSQAFQSIGIYTFSNFFTKAVSFASLPLFTYIITKRDFGIISIFSAAMVFIMPFTSLGILYSTSTDFFKLDKRKFASFITTTSFLPVIMSLLTGLIFFIFYPFFKERAGFMRLFIILLPVSVYCNFLYEQSLLLIRNNNESMLYLWVNLCKIVIELGVAFFLIWLLGVGWEGRVWGITFAFVLSGVFSFYYFFKKSYLTGPLDFRIIKQELIYSLPALSTQLSIIFLSYSDRFFINYYYGADRTGVYSISATFASIVFIFNSALIQYIFPKLFTSFAQKSELIYVRKLFGKYLLLMLAASAALVLVTLFCYYFLLNRIYLGGIKYFFILLAGYLIWAVTYFFYSIMLYFKEKRKMLILSAISIGFCAIVSNYFIKREQEYGATKAVIISYFLVFILIILFNKNRLKTIFGK